MTCGSDNKRYRWLCEFHGEYVNSVAATRANAVLSG